MQRSPDNAYTLQPPEILALKQKIEICGTPLKDWDISINYGIKTGFNEAFIIDNDTKDALCKQDPKPAEIIKPILRGRDIKAYESNWVGLWIIATFPSLKINIDNYPVVKKYLQSFGKRIHQIGETGTRKKTGNKWFETQDQIAYYESFAKEKIIYPIISSEPRFTFDDSNYYTNDKCFLITSNNNLQPLVAILNSCLSFWYLCQIGSLLGTTGFEFRKIYVEQLPIPQLSKSKQQPFIKLADKIITAKQDGKDTSDLETQIDQMVYQLYDLTADEIKIIETSK